MPPLRHAVGFVDGKQRDFRLRQQHQRTVLHQAFRCDVEHVKLTGDQLPLDLLLRCPVQCRIEIGSADANRFQCINLVLHQGNQRRDDDASAGPDQGRNLVAQRFAAASRHQHQRITAVNQRFDDFRLMRAETLVAKHLLKDIPCTVHRRLLGRGYRLGISLRHRFGTPTQALTSGWCEVPLNNGHRGGHWRTGHGRTRFPSSVPCP